MRLLHIFIIVGALCLAVWWVMPDQQGSDESRQKADNSGITDTERSTSPNLSQQIADVQSKGGAPMKAKSDPTVADQSANHAPLPQLEEGNGIEQPVGAPAVDPPIGRVAEVASPKNEVTDTDSSRQIDPNVEMRLIAEEDQRLKEESERLTPPPLPDGPLEPKLDLQETPGPSVQTGAVPPAIPDDLPDVIKKEDRAIKAEGQARTQDPENPLPDEPSEDVPAIPVDLAPEIQAEDRKIKAEGEHATGAKSDQAEK